MTPTLAKCDFCNELSGGWENSFSRIYRPHLESRVLLRSNNFAVVPSLGQIVESYLLVLPIKHFKAVGDLPRHYLDEFVAVCQSVVEVFNNESGPNILFEHGTRSEGVGGCGIYHAHLHAVPLGKVSDPIDALKSRFPYAELTHLSEISRQSAGLPSYLFYQDSDAKLYLFDTGPLPSQYMRKLLADALGKEEWDWRTSGREERLLATIQKLSGQFESAPNSLTSQMHDAP
jgi:diadenosine tetraphosphate (Ap4A) HIT family hydrolase